MEMSSAQVYDSLIHGAYKVIQNKEILNRINVFPIQDGDTGSNLASMMRSIINKSEAKRTVKQTLESVADAALHGARGNSGIIFAQYLNGLSESIGGGEHVSIHEYARACHHAVKYAYASVEEPIEGTMITIMRAWGTALVDESQIKTSIYEIFNSAYVKLESALEKTTDQLSVLKKAGVVDSGAKGFTYFIEGAIYYIKNGKDIDIQSIYEQNQSDNQLIDIENHVCNGDDRYCTEGLLERDGIDIKMIKNHLKSLGSSIVVAGNQQKCRIHIHTNEPIQVFEFLHAMGSVIYQKVDDMFKQEAIVNKRRSNIALITDSIADLPKTYIDEYQIHMVHLDILFKDRIYMDKMTIEPSRLLTLSANEEVLPTSSQPNPKQLENMLDYLSTYYDSAVVMTVSKELSGTYNNFQKVAKNFGKRDFNISVINTKQNSGAQGLLVKKCSEFIDQGLRHEDVVKKTLRLVEESKILVQVRSLDNMIKSGRLSVKAGKIAKKIGMKPIVTLDHEGKGALDSVAFSIQGSNKKIIKHFKKLLKTRTIDQYCIVHIDNEQGAYELSVIMSEIIGFKPVYVTDTSSIVAVGAGSGAVAVSYLTNRKDV